MTEETVLETKKGRTVMKQRRTLIAVKPDVVVLEDQVLDMTSPELQSGPALKSLFPLEPKRVELTAAPSGAVEARSEPTFIEQFTQRKETREVGGLTLPGTLTTCVVETKARRVSSRSWGRDDIPGYFAEQETRSRDLATGDELFWQRTLLKIETR